MKLAIPYEEGQIFGKTPAFKIYDIANGQVGGSIPAPPTKPPRTLPRASWWLTPTLSATTTTAATPAATTAKDMAAEGTATEARPGPPVKVSRAFFCVFYPLSISAKNLAKYQRIFSEKITENGCNLQEVLL